MFKKENKVIEKEFEEYKKRTNCTLQEEYKSHEIFNEIDKYIKFYDLLSSSIISWIALGTGGMINFNSYILSSMKGTLESINLILKHGKINDAFALTRKYYDNVIINIYAILYLEDNHSPESIIIEKINDWVQNKEKLPDYKEMNNYIRKSNRLKSINNLIFTGDYYQKMRQRLNDHTHYNYFKYMLYNDNQEVDVYNKRIKFLEQLNIDIKNIFILHFIWLFSVKDNYMMSDNYIDHMEVGMTPPENSEYWVAPFVQKIFDDVIKKNRPDLVEEFKNSTRMELI